MSAHVVVSGEDAADFLQSQFSNDLRPFTVGQCTYGLWLDVKGKIVADSWVYCEGEESFRIFSERCDGAQIKEKLERHIVADDVELELDQSTTALGLVGEGVHEEIVRADAAFGFHGRRSGETSCELIFANKSGRQAWLDGNDIEIVSDNWIQGERMKWGVPQVCCEVFPGDLPAEAGLVGDAVSLTKGCFLGQEVVARLHNLGRPQRSLFVLTGSGDPPDVPLPVSNEDGKSLGELRTCVAEPEGWEGVAMLKSRFVEFCMQLIIAEQAAIVERAFTRKD